MTTVNYQRTLARVVRAGNTTAHLSIKAWCQGQITVPVSTLGLVAATGLARHELLGTDLIITANLSAATDTEVDPHAFRVAQVAHPRVLSAAA
jgi:hypothetical protein